MALTVAAVAAAELIWVGLHEQMLLQLALEAVALTAVFQDTVTLFLAEAVMVDQAILELLVQPQVEQAVAEVAVQLMEALARKDNLEV